MKGRTAGFMLENHLWLELEMDRINLMMLAILIVAILFYSKDKGEEKWRNRICTEDTENSGIPVLYKSIRQNGIFTKE